MATLNWSFANLIKGDEAEKEVTTNMVMSALSDSPRQREVRVHDALRRDLRQRECARMLLGCVDEKRRMDNTKAAPTPVQTTGTYVGRYSRTPNRSNLRSDQHAPSHQPGVFSVRNPQLP